MNYSIEIIQNAIDCASRNHMSKPEVRHMVEKREQYAEMVRKSIIDGTCRSRMEYRHLDRTNSNGKQRSIESPSLYTRVLQHLFLLNIMPTYEAMDPGIAVNCKKKGGIMAKMPSRSVIHRMKNLVYERRDLHYCVIMDQAKCYDHITKKLFRKSLKYLTDDRELINFGIDVTFYGNIFPIGTPTSPPAHHIIMLKFDRWLGGVAPFKLRYADDLVMAFRTKEEANQAKWRVANFWWYELGMRVKTKTCRLQDLDKEKISYCGLVLQRNVPDRDGHDKGFTKLRRNIVDRARKCRRNESWASYFGIMSRTDSYRTMKTIEERMKLSELTSKIRIDRGMDAKNIEIAQLVDKSFNIVDFEIRYDSNKSPNWLKCFVSFPETLKNRPTGKVVIREFHGNYKYLIEFLVRCLEAQPKESLLPIEDVTIENSCGYIFKGSTHQAVYIEDFMVMQQMQAAQGGTIQNTQPVPTQYAVQQPVGVNQYQQPIPATQPAPALTAAMQYAHMQQTCGIQTTYVGPTTFTDGNVTKMPAPGTGATDPLTYM